MQLQRTITWIATDWQLKLTAFALAFLLWTTVRADTPGQWEQEIAVRVQNTDADWVVAGSSTPATVSVVFRGPLEELLRAASEPPSIIVPFEEVTDSVEVSELRHSWVRMPPGTDNLDVVDFRPSSVRVAFDRVATRLVPVAVELTGSPPAGFELAGRAQVDPAAVRASGAARTLAGIDSLRLPPVDLRERRTLDTLEVTIDTTGTGLVISPRTVRVIVPIRPILSDTGALGLSTQRRNESER